MTQYIYKLKNILFALILVFSGCNSTDFDSASIETDEVTTINISFKDEGVQTRSNSGQADSSLSKETLSFFLFKKDEQGDTRFLLAPDMDKVTVSKDNTQENTYNISFKIPDARYGKVLMVALKNYEGPNPSKLQSNPEFCEANLIANYKDLIQDNNVVLYGDTEFDGNKKNINAKIQLINPLARVDINIDHSKFPEAIYTYTVKSIASVRVYRPQSQSSLYYNHTHLNTQGSIIKPNVPVTSKYYLSNGQASSDLAEADKLPIIYDLSNAPVTEYENHILLSEIENKEDAQRKDVASIIVGVYLENPEYAGQQRYYRLDFAEYTKGEIGPKSYRSVLRNHIYNFTLGGAQTPGTGNPDEALTAPSSLWLDLKVWNQEEISSIVNGEYYFRMESSDIKLGYQAGSSISIPYKTNIKEDLSSIIELVWGDNSTVDNQHFTASVNTINQTITIETKAENTTAQQNTSELHLRIMNHAFKLKISQMDRRPDFYISQTAYTVNGVYVRNKPLIEGEHTVTVRLYARNKNEVIKDLKYELSATEIEGIYIDNIIGIFDNVQVDERGVQYQDITLNIKGKSTYPKNKRLTILAIGKEESFLNANIPYAYIPKKVLGLFGTSSANKLSSNTNFKKLISSTENYGLENSSKVKAEEIIYMETSSNNLAAEIQANKPDVIIWGDGYTLNQDQATALKNFMTKRNDLNGPGVVLAMNANVSSVSTLFSQLQVNQGSISNISMSHNYNSISPGSQADTQDRYRLPVYDWDLGVSGSFGELGTRYIQLPSNSISLTNLKFEYVLKYTGNLAYGQNKDKYDYAVSSCRLSHYPLFWVGSNSFLDNKQWKFEGNKIVNTPTTEYNSSGEIYKMKLTTNSIFFANLLEWAFKTSEYGLNN